MSATDELRRLLDERGIEHDDEFVKSRIPYCDGYEGTYWGGDSFGYVEPIRPKPNTIGSHPELTIHDCTPEQAIAATLGANDGNKLKSDVRAADVDANDANATLGGGKLTAEQVRGAIEENSWAETSTIREFNDSSWQAIADELNAALGGGECEYVIEDNMNESEGMGDVWFRCTNCDMKFDYYADGWLMTQGYCPHCGFKIRKAVER